MRSVSLLFTAAIFCTAFSGTVAKSEEIGTPPISRVTPTNDVKWVGMAVSRTGGRIFQSELNDHENGARAAAINECENRTGVSCANAISVPSGWDIAVLRCGTDYFLGGSGQGFADDIAFGKAASAGYFRGSCGRVAGY